MRGEFADEPGELAIDGAVAVGLVVDASAFDAAIENAGRLEMTEFAQHGAAASANGSRKFAHIQRASAPGKEQREHSAARAAEQSRRDRDVANSRPHIGDNTITRRRGCQAGAEFLLGARWPASADIMKARKPAHKHTAGERTRVDQSEQLKSVGIRRRAW